MEFQELLNFKQENLIPRRQTGLVLLVNFEQLQKLLSRNLYNFSG